MRLGAFSVFIFITLYKALFMLREEGKITSVDFKDNILHGYQINDSG